MINIVLMNSHVDLSQKNKDDVITYSMDTTNYFLLNPSIDQRVNMYYMKSKVELNDEINQLWRQPVELKTFQFDKSYHYQEPKNAEDLKNSPLYTMYLRVGSNQRMYARRSYTMLAYLGDLGGLIDIIWIFGAFLTAIMTRNVLQAAMITDSYHV